MGFTASHPQIKLSMTSDALDILVKQLNDGFTDLAFVTHVDKNYLIGLESKTIMKSPLIAVMHPTHALANRDSLSIKDLSGFPMINFSPQANPITSDFNKQIFKKAGAQLNIVREIPNIETAAFCASINEGIFIMPEYLRLFYWLSQNNSSVRPICLCYTQSYLEKEKSKHLHSCVC